MREKLQSTPEAQSGFLPRILCLPVICLWEAFQRDVGLVVSQVNLSTLRLISSPAFSMIPLFLLINIHPHATHYFYFFEVILGLFI